MTRCQAIEKAAVAVVALYDNDDCRLTAIGYDNVGDRNPLDDLIEALARPKRKQREGLT